MTWYEQLYQRIATWTTLDWMWFGLDAMVVCYLCARLRQLFWRRRKEKILTKLMSTAEGRQIIVQELANGVIENREKNGKQQFSAENHNSPNEEQ